MFSRLKKNHHNLQDKILTNKSLIKSIQKVRVEIFGYAAYLLGKNKLNLAQKNYTHQRGKRSTDLAKPSLQ
jgi:hypothetical protein